MSMKEIKMNTTVAELLNDYEGMKDILIEINPKFKKLNNPVLRRTLAKVATVKQAAIVGGMKPSELLNKLREKVGQKPLETGKKIDDIDIKLDEDIASIPPKETIDANQLLNEEKNPLAVIFNKLRTYDSGEVIKITSDFKPEPLIEEFINKGHKVFCKELDEKSYETYVQK